MLVKAFDLHKIEIMFLGYSKKEHHKVAKFVLMKMIVGKIHFKISKTIYSMFWWVSADGNLTREGTSLTNAYFSPTSNKEW